MRRHILDVTLTSDLQGQIAIGAKNLTQEVRFFRRC